MEVYKVRKTLDLLTWVGCKTCPAQRIGSFGLLLVVPNVNVSANQRYRLESETVLQSSPQSGIQSSPVADGNTLAGNEVYRIRGTHMVNAVVPAGGTGTDGGEAARKALYDNAEAVIRLFQHGRRFRVPDVLPQIARNTEYTMSDIDDRVLGAMLLERSELQAAVAEDVNPVTAFEGVGDQAKMGVQGEIAIIAPPSIGSEYRDDDVMRLPVIIQFVATAYPAGDGAVRGPIREAA